MYKIKNFLSLLSLIILFFFLDLACKKKAPERQNFTTHTTATGIRSFNILGTFGNIIPEKDGNYLVEFTFLGPELMIKEQLSFLSPEIELLNSQETFIEPNPKEKQNFNNEIIYFVKNKQQHENDQQERGLMIINPESEDQKANGIQYKVKINIKNINNLSDKICNFSVGNTKGFIRYLSENKGKIQFYVLENQSNLNNITPTVKLCHDQAHLTPVANIPQNFTNPNSYISYSPDRQKQTNYQTETIFLPDEARLKSIKIANKFGQIDYSADKVFFNLSALEFGTGLLTPIITISEGSIISPESNATVQFKNYTLNNVFYYDYLIKNETVERICRIFIYTDEDKLKNAKITEFKVAGKVADLDEANKKISLNLTANQFGTGNLTPIITYIGKKIDPNSGSPTQFVSGQEKKYTVTAHDDITTVDYQVLINGLSNEAKITDFKILNQPANIDETNKKISLSLTAEEFSNGKLTPTIVISDKATVQPNSGFEQDFVSGVAKNYLVTAEDGTEVTYQVTVKTLATENTLETIKIKNQNPNSEILGIIDPADDTITFDNYNPLRDYQILELIFKGKSLSINTTPVYNCALSPCAAMPSTTFNGTTLLKNHTITVTSEAGVDRIYQILTTELSIDSKLNTISITEGSNIIIGGVDDTNKKITFNNVNPNLNYQISALTFTGKTLELKKGTTTAHNCNVNPCAIMPSVTFNNANLLTAHKIVVTSVAAGTARNVNEYQIIVNYLAILPIPTNIVATHAICGPDQTLDLSWNAVTNAGKYKISYRRGNTDVFTDLEINAPNTSTKINIPQNQTDVPYDIKIQAIPTNPATHVNSLEALATSTLRTYQMKEVESFTAVQKGDNILNHEIAWKLADGEPVVQTGTVSYKWINMPTTVNNVNTYTYEQELEQSRTDYLKLTITPKMGCLAPPSKEIKVTTANIIDFNIDLLPNVPVTLNSTCNTVYVTDGNQLDFSQKNHYILENDVTIPNNHGTGTYDCVLDGKGHTIFGLQKTLLTEMTPTTKIMNVIFDINEITAPVLIPTKRSGSLALGLTSATVIMNNVIVKVNKLNFPDNTTDIGGVIASLYEYAYISQTHLRVSEINLPNTMFYFGLITGTVQEFAQLSQSSVMVKNPININTSNQVVIGGIALQSLRGELKENFAQITFRNNNNNNIFISGLVNYTDMGKINNCIFNGTITKTSNNFLITEIAPSNKNKIFITDNLYSGGTPNLAISNQTVPNSNYAPATEGVQNQGETRVSDLNTETFDKLDDNIWYKEPGKWPILKWMKDRINTRKK